jgi:hypothetical protein
VDSYGTNVYVLTGLTIGGLWTGMEDHTTWTLIYIDCSTCTAQLDHSGHVSSTCLAQLDRSGHMSSTCLAQFDCLSHVITTINITSSLSRRCLSNIVDLLLRASHNVPHVLHGQMT